MFQESKKHFENLCIFWKFLKFVRLGFENLIFFIKIEVNYKKV